MNSITIARQYGSGGRAIGLAIAKRLNIPYYDKQLIALAAKQSGVELYEYTPLQVKSAVTGYGKAEKPQVMEMTRRLLRLAEVPKPDDTADALAIAICHGQCGGTALKRRIFQG